MAQCITVQELSEDFGVSRSTVLKWLKKNGFECVRVRTYSSCHQLTCALMPEDAERARALRKAQGFGDALGTAIVTGDAA